MTSALSALAKKETSLLFTPHMIPMTRGILATCYASSTATTEQCLASARKFYEGRPFVRVVDKPPHTKWATGSNLVYVSYAADPKRGTVIALGAIDNLGKGRCRAGGAERKFDDGFAGNNGIGRHAVVAVTRRIPPRVPRRAAAGAVFRSAIARLRTFRLSTPRLRTMRTDQFSTMTFNAMVRKRADLASRFNDGCPRLFYRPYTLKQAAKRTRLCSVLRCESAHEACRARVRDVAALKDLRARLA